MQNQIITDQSQHKGNHYFMHYFKEKETKPWFSKIDYPRFHLTTVNRIRANHYNLAASLFRKNMSDSPYCQCGHNTQDINHVLWDCHNLHNHRYSLKGQLGKYYRKRHKKDPPELIEEILTNPKDPPTKFVTDYLKKCQLHI